MLSKLANFKKNKTSSAPTSLARVTKLALKLPETSRKIHGSHAQFLVGKKTFAYFLDNHHGDGIVSITVQGFAQREHRTCRRAA